jgi:hypothetical protein
VLGKFEGVLRKVAERTVPGLHQTIACLVLQVSVPGCSNEFRHSGPKSALREDSGEFAACFS